MIGIICAMQVEANLIRETMEEIKEEQIGDKVFFSGRIAGKDVVATVCGIGKVSAAMSTQAMIMKYSPDVILNTGVAGSLSKDLHILDIVVSDQLVEHDMDTSPIGDPLGYISDLGQVFIPADKAAVACAEKSAANLGIKIHKGTIASGDQFIHSAEQKEFITSNFNAVSCEMEGAAIAHVCCANHVPFCVVRSMSDCADGSSTMNYAEFCPIAADKAAKLITEFIKNF